MELNLNSVDLTELLKHENGYVLYEGREGSIVREGKSGTVISDIPDADRLCTLLKQLDPPDFDLVEVKSEETAEMIRRTFGFNGCNPCTQWVYAAEKPPKALDCDIRLLTQEYAETVGEHYHENYEYAQERIDAERVWGVFDDKRLAGFIGMHPEGAVGMLEIFPEYRRKGYAFALEAYLFSLHLQRGWVPYCHVIDGNNASVQLQKKLGMQCADRPAIWLWKE